MASPGIRGKSLHFGFLLCATLIAALRQHQERSKHLCKFFKIHGIPPPEKLAQEMAEGYFTDIPLYSKWNTPALTINKSFSSFRSFHTPSTMLTTLVHEHSSSQLPRWKECHHYIDRKVSKQMNCIAQHLSTFANQ